MIGRGAALDARCAAAPPAARARAPGPRTRPAAWGAPRPRRRAPRAWPAGSPANSSALTQQPDRLLEQAPAPAALSRRWSRRPRTPPGRPAAGSSPARSGPGAPARSTPAAARPGPAARLTGPTLSRSSSTIRSAPFLPMPGHLGQRRGVAHARWQSATCRGCARSAPPARCAARPRWPSAAARRAASRRRRRNRTGSASLRARSGVAASRACCPTRRDDSVAGAQCSASPTPPTSTTATSAPIAATVPATLAIIAHCLPERVFQLLLGAAAPHVADRQRERVRRVGRDAAGCPIATVWSPSSSSASCPPDPSRSRRP